MPDDGWASSPVESVFERVPGADVPDLRPATRPAPLRRTDPAIARRNGHEIPQPGIAADTEAAGRRR